MQRLTMLEYKHYRYLKMSSMLMAVAILAYIIHHPSLGPRGDTWLGYTLGSIGALQVLILLWYAVMSRRMPVLAERRETIAETQLKKSNISDRRLKLQPLVKRNASTLQGWLSAHIYLGLALLVIITLHTGFRFGGNIHTLTYVLLLAVVLTGLYGVYAYLRFPRMMTENLGEDRLSTLLADIAQLDQLARTNALRLPDEIGEVVRQASRETAITESFMELIQGRARRCATRTALDKLQGMNNHLNHVQDQIFRDISALLLRKESQLKRVRMELMYQARLKLWLHLHVPLAIGLLAALVAHITAVFFFR